MKTVYLFATPLPPTRTGRSPATTSRPLTDEGVERFRLQVRGLRELEVAP